LIDRELLEILVCPRCKGEVKLKEDRTAILCYRCNLAYPVEDDIPVMLASEAKKL
jgi:uncharacterized protein YbaR (Trm112 family)